MTSSSSTTAAPYGLLLLLFILSTLLLWVSVVALSPAEGAAKPKMTTMTATTDALQQQFTAKPGEARSEDSHSNSNIENSTVSEAALKPEETFHRGSVLAAFDKLAGTAGAAFADGWVEVDEAENVGEEILGGHLGEAHHHLHHQHHHRPPHSHHPKFASIEDDSLSQQQSYECVLMPKLRPTYSEANTAEVVDDLINAGHHQVHHLYGVDVEDDEEDENGFHHPHSRHHKKATKRRAKSASSVSASTSSSSTSKLRDFGNFLYVDDTARPSYTSLESMEFASASSSSSSPPPSSKHQKTKRGHRKASSLTKKSSHGSDSGSQELDQLFSSLKSSLDQLLCYQNEECYGGEMGGELRGREGEEKLEAFIRHVRASKKVFELLERNRHRLMEVAGGGGGGGGSKEMMAVAPHPEPGRIAEPGGPHLHLPHRFMAFDPMRELIGFGGGGGGPVAPMYDDTVQRSMAVKAPPSLYRKLMKSGGRGSVGKCKLGNGWFN